MVNEMAGRSVPRMVLKVYLMAAESEMMKVER
jgi:hypothetical protein